jgi:hypothetical protein
MTINNASLIEPEVDLAPFGDAAEIFKHLCGLSRGDKPTFVAFHNGRILLSSSGPGHRQKIDDIGEEIESQHWGRKLHQIFTSTFSATVWEVTL